MFCETIELYEILNADRKRYMCLSDCNMFVNISKQLVAFFKTFRVI